MGWSTKSVGVFHLSLGPYLTVEPWTKTCLTARQSLVSPGWATSQGRSNTLWQMNRKLWNIALFYGKILCKWQFSTAMLVIARGVDIDASPCRPCRHPSCAKVGIPRWNFYFEGTATGWARKTALPKRQKRQSLPTGWKKQPCTSYKDKSLTNNSWERSWGGAENWRSRQKVFTPLLDGWETLSSSFATPFIGNI